MKKILLRPVITEKTMIEANTGKFTFAVGLQSTKKEIAQEIESSFKVQVLGVTTITMKGKAKRVGARRTKVAKRPWKKAIVTLAAGQKIDLFDVVGEQK